MRLLKGIPAALMRMFLLQEIADGLRPKNAFGRLLFSYWCRNCLR